ncbi:MAG: hypothetical protein WBP12_01780 [Candidatus Saccharimonas sp.]
MSRIRVWYPMSPVLRSADRQDRDLAGNPVLPPENSRDYLVPLYGTYIPNRSQVGCTKLLSELTEFNLPSTIDLPITSPVEWTDKIIYGRVKVSGAGKITATNCIFLGSPGVPPTTGETAVLDFDNAGTTGSVFKDCTIAPRYPHPRLNGFKGSRHKVERCHIIWCIDGLGPYTKPTYSFPTDVEVVGTLIERLVYFPGYRYADHYPNYWDGNTWTGTGSVGRTLADGSDMMDSGHADGNHSDCIEIHNAYGTHTFNSGTGKWTGDGVHIWGNALIADDAYGQNDDPTGLGIPVPGQPGSASGSSLGLGDNPRRGLPGGGQRPQQVRPITSGWTRPVPNGKYAANGASIYIGQIVSPFQDITSVVVHDNYLDGGNMSMQEQKKGYTSISFNFYDNIFGPNYFMWNTAQQRDVYPVRINDYVSGSNLSSTGDTITQSSHLLTVGDHIRFTDVKTSVTLNTSTNYYIVATTGSTFKVSATSGGSPINVGTVSGLVYTGSNIMPNWTTGPVRIANHPATGAPPFGAGASNRWLDPGNKWGMNGQPLILGSGSVAGVRVV